MSRIRFGLPMLLALSFLVGPAPAQLELYLSFDDPLNPAADTSGNNRETFLNNEIFDFEVNPIDDEVRGPVLEFPGGNNGFVYAELPELSGDGFTIMMWAYRDPELCCEPDSGANDGLFHVQLDGDPEIGPSGAGASKIIGGWVQKSDGGVWGRIHDENGVQSNLERADFFMEDEEWVHYAYRGNGEDYELIVDGEVVTATVYDASLGEHDSIFVGKQGTETWGGRLDDVLVYSTALTDEEIIDIMMNGPGGSEPGDFNADGNVDALDIDLMSAEIRAGTNGAAFDLAPPNDVVDADDRRFLVEQLMNTYIGDSNLDGEFNSSDLVFLFTKGEYQDGVPNNSGWVDGDWNGDTEFTSSDFVTAFTAGGYELGPRQATAAVPEPVGMGCGLLVVLGLLLRRRR